MIYEPGFRGYVSTTPADEARTEAKYDVPQRNPEAFLEAMTPEERRAWDREIEGRIRDERFYQARVLDEPTR